jgi:cbb3-type cytochrome oxidase subunit 3
MSTKSIVIVIMFLAVLIMYFYYVFNETKKENFEEDTEEDKETQDNSREAFESDVDTNLKIISAYEEVHGKEKKISSKELTQLIEEFKKDGVTEKSDMVKKIRDGASQKTDASLKADLDELVDISARLSKLTTKLETTYGGRVQAKSVNEQGDGAVKEKFMVEPFANERNFMNF